MESPAASQHRLVAQPNSPIDAFSYLLAPIHPFMVIPSLLVAKRRTTRHSSGRLDYESERSCIPSSLQRDWCSPRLCYHDFLTPLPTSAPTSRESGWPNLYSRVARTLILDASIDGASEIKKDQAIKD